MSDFDTRLSELRDEINSLSVDTAQKDWERRLNLANVPKSLRNISSDLIPDELEYKAKIMNWPRYYFNTSVLNNEPAIGMYLFGPPGSGKTSILAGTTIGLVRARIGAYFFKAKDLISEFSSPTYMNRDINDLTVADYLFQVRVLNLDDIFVVGENRFGDMVLDSVEQLLRDRWSSGLTTNISCNLSVQKLAERNGRLASVIEEMTQPVEVKGVNIRKLVSHKDVF